MVIKFNRKLYEFKNYYTLGYLAKQQLKKINWYVKFTIWYRNQKKLKQRCRCSWDLITKLKNCRIVKPILLRMDALERRISESYVW